MAKQQPKGKKPAPRKSGGTMMQTSNSSGSSNNPVMLPNVTVTAKRPARADLKLNTTSAIDAIKSLPKIQNQSIKKDSSATGGKKMGRAMTALSDASSLVRGAANRAFGKNKSKTTGGKILERIARVGAAATGVGMLPAGAGLSYARSIAKGTNKLTGYMIKNTIPAAQSAARSAAAAIGAGATILPAIMGQINFNERSEEDKKRGIYNPGRGNANFDKINFDKPFEKTKGRDVPLPDSSSLFED